MTVPKVNTIKRGDARFYVSPDDGVKYPGVTSILNCLPKPFLKFWASKVVAEEAIDNLPALVTMALNNPTNFRTAAVDMLKKAPDRFTGKAADTGTAAHELFERMSKGETLGRVHPDLVPFVTHFGEFLDVVKPEYIHLEETVWSDAHRYAGSFDATAMIDGQLVWLDNKTTRSGVHAEVGLQLAAYRNAEHILRADGTRTPNNKGDGAAVLHVRPEGWQLVPVKADDEMFEFFLKLRSIFDYDREVSKSVVGAPIAYGPPELAIPKTRAPRVPKAVAA